MDVSRAFPAYLDDQDEEKVKKNRIERKLNLLEFYFTNYCSNIKIFSKYMNYFFNLMQCMFTSIVINILLLLGGCAAYGK